MFIYPKLRIKNNSRFNRQKNLDILGITSYHTRMDFDYDKWLEEERQRDHQVRQARVEKHERKKAHDGECAALTPQQLAERLAGYLNPDDIENMDDLFKRLPRQARTLDDIFYTSLHSAGLGFKHKLEKDPLQAALIAQRQCRQIFDSLKNARTHQTCKQKEGPEK